MRKRERQSQSQREDKRENKRERGTKREAQRESKRQTQGQYSRHLVPGPPHAQAFERVPKSPLRRCDCGSAAVPGTAGAV